VVQISGKVHEDPGRRAAPVMGAKRCRECSNSNHRSLGLRLKVYSEIAGSVPVVGNGNTVPRALLEMRPAGLNFVTTPRHEGLCLVQGRNQDLRVRLHALTERLPA
jgi:hypothetical protein